MENLRADIYENKKTASVEIKADHEANDALLLFERVNNPIIKNQILDLLYRNEEVQSGEVRIVPDIDSNGRWLKDENGNDLFREEPYVPKTRDEVRDNFNKCFSAAQKDTPISFSSESPRFDYETGREVMPLAFCWPHSGKLFSVKDKSIAEAHEKGHVIRRFDSDFFRDYFSKGFDQSFVAFTDNDYAVDKSLNKEAVTYGEAKEHFFYYLFSGMEIAERMSQLKNYFGMRGAEEFTKEHLFYAKAHYIDDLSFDNRMTHFFQAITPEKEDAFIELINSSGI